MSTVLAIEAINDMGSLGFVGPKTLGEGNVLSFDRKLGAIDLVLNIINQRNIV